MVWWLWLVLGFFLIGFEMFLPAGFALLIIGLSFVITGLATAVGFNDPAWLQWCICLVSFIVLFVLVRKPLLRLFGLTEPSNYRELDGQEVVLTSDILPNQVGSGEMQGTRWTVRNVGTKPLQSGDRIAVKKVDGLTLEVGD